MAKLTTQSAGARSRSITKANLCSLLILVSFCVLYLVFDSIALAGGNSAGDASAGSVTLGEDELGAEEEQGGEVTDDGIDPYAGVVTAENESGEGVQLDGQLLTLKDQSVVWTKVVENEGLNRDIIGICLWTEKNIAGMKVTNRNGYHGQRNFHTSKKPRVKELARIVERFVESIMTSFQRGMYVSYSVHI